MKHGALLDFVRAIDCLPVTKRPRRPNAAKLAFLSNWTALVVSRYFEADDEQERLELQRKMEAFLAPFVNTGFGK